MDNKVKAFEAEFERYNERNAKFDIARGLYKEDLFVLLTEVEKLKAGDIYVELGVSQGSSILAVADFRKDIKCFGVEININNNATGIAKQLGLDNVEVISGSTEEICKSWTRRIDLLFIDGEHSFPQIFYDYVGWERYVKMEKVILFHDWEHKERNGAKFEVYLLEKLFRNHRLFEFFLPSRDAEIDSSMMVLKKKYQGC